ncbi:MAG: AAA family ATPase [Bifidobacterium psychraerophilum]|uniref:ATP-dependent nuclease n=1 Tax=Bifidobacterium psychraerophilum TaxID=218140 RepID=UPI0039EA4133
MRLQSIKIWNHKRLSDLKIDVRDHLILVGANDVGKSSLLRCLDLLLGSSTAQLYAHISVDDFRDTDQPFIIEGALCDFTETDKALFPDEIHVDPDTNKLRLVIRLAATIDEGETVTIDRSAPEGGTGRQLSRDQLLGLGWKFLSATSQLRELRENRESPLDDILKSVELGDEQSEFEKITTTLISELGDSKVLEGVRSSLADQLSKALPEKISQTDLAFVPGAAADNDVLSDVRLQVSKHGIPHELSQQSDGMRALYAMAFYDMTTTGAYMVGIDEPEIHLHPSSQRSLARLLKSNSNQKILATHSSDIVSAFDPDSIVVLRPGGIIKQPKNGFLSNDDRTSVRMWVRNRLEPLTARRVIIVEGISDRIILEHLADLTDRNLDRLGVSLIEANGAGDMVPFEKLFGSNGFDVPMSRLIDEDAEENVAKKITVDVSELSSRSIWVSRKDLEDEYVHALGAETVWSALKTNGHFTSNELSCCKTTGSDGAHTDADIADFCRRKSTYKVKACLSVLPIFDETTARKVTSIESLLSEISQ